MRTLSKVGLAGLRLGMLFGRPEWLNEINKIRMPYNINVLTQVSAAIALKHFDVLDQQCPELKQQREWLHEELSALGFVAYKSEANFILARVKTDNARDIFEALKTHKILIKCMDGAHPLLAQCLRFTVGKADENKALVAALKAIV
jgi:histidinol-phosphate aminotransferase